MKNMEEYNFNNWELIVKNRVATLILNREEQNNTINGETLSELNEIITILESNDDIWAAVVEAKGHDFSFGVDINLIGAMMDQSKEEYRKSLRGTQEILDRFERLKKPTIAAIQGHCIGGGMILALCCDFRVAEEDVIICFPEVKRSIGVIMGTQRISRLAGISATKEIVMLGKPLDATRALQMGLVNQIVNKQDLHACAHSWADSFLALPPLAVGVCKEIINNGLYDDRAGQDFEIIAQESLLDTDDMKEAISSFFEKRKPEYVGK